MIPLRGGVGIFVGRGLSPPDVSYEGIHTIAMSLLRAKEKPPEAIVKDGWLYKEGGVPRSKWQNRWFRLQGKNLHYFSKKDDAHPQASINLDSVLDISKIGEHSGKHYCLSLVTTKSGSSNKKVVYLAADSEELLCDWYSALQNITTPEPSIKLVKYATAEVFLTQGVRIMGDVHYNILSTISHRVSYDRKKRDSLGWFCDRPIALAMVLNLFAEYGWSPERIYRSSAVSGTENTIHPVIRVIFSKSPPLPTNPDLLASIKKSAEAASPSLTRSGRFDSVSVSAQPVTSPVLPGTKMLEGADNELIALMQEFDIPLTLLQVPSAE